MQPDTDDLHAIRRLKSGDIGGLEILIARYQGKALRAAFLVTHDNAMAEDVVQEAFVRFFHRAHYFDERYPFEPYFTRSVVNAALNAVQKEKKVQHFDFAEAEVSALEALLERAASVEAQAEFNTLKQEIFEALAMLPPRQSAVIVQRYYLEMTEKEMAEALEAPPGTIKWLLNAARARLRSLLGPERMAE